MEFDLQPTLTGRFLEARPLHLEDWPALFSAASDPMIWEQHPEPDRYKREVFQKFFDAAMESGGAFAVVDLESGRVIGSSRYYKYNRSTREVMIGYTFIEKAFWGRGYNAELKALMLGHAFQFVDRVLFEVGRDNVRSQRALQKLGAQFVEPVEFEGLDGRMKRGFIFAIGRQ